MAGYIVYWAKDYVRSVQKAGDKGPLKVVYGSQHTVMPYITSVEVGDIIYPVTLSNGTLAVMARLPVEKIEPAFDYTVREIGRRCSALVPEGVVYYTKGKDGEFVCLSYGCGYVTGKFTYFNETARKNELRIPDNISREYREWEMKEFPHSFTQVPKTCCAKQAASGEHGSDIFPREIPLETAKTLLFGKTEESQKPLKLDSKGHISTISLSGFVRKMSDEAFTVFEKLF